MTENTAAQVSADDRSLSDADLDAVAGGVEHGGAWRQGSKGQWVYDGWAREGSKVVTETGSSTRKEYAAGGKINLYNHDNKLLKTFDGSF